MFNNQLHLVWAPDHSVYLLNHECGDVIVVCQPHYLLCLLSKFLVHFTENEGQPCWCYSSVNCKRLTLSFGLWVNEIDARICCCGGKGVVEGCMYFRGLGCSTLSSTSYGVQMPLCIS